MDPLHTRPPARSSRLLVAIVGTHRGGPQAGELAELIAPLAALADVEVLRLSATETPASAEAPASVGRPLRILVDRSFTSRERALGSALAIAVREDHDAVAVVEARGLPAPRVLPTLVAAIFDGGAEAALALATRPGLPPAIDVSPPPSPPPGRLRALLARVASLDLGEGPAIAAVYSTRALGSVPFRRLAPSDLFEQELRVQLTRAGGRFVELRCAPTSTSPTPPLRRVRSALAALRFALRLRLQQMELLYDPRFDLRDPATHEIYELKLGFDSSHEAALAAVADGDRVLDLGCAGGRIGAELHRRGCRVTGTDRYPLAPGVTLDRFLVHDLDDGLPPVDLSGFDRVLLLDVIEHLEAPERFVDSLRDALAGKRAARVVLSTANVGFFLTRLGLLFGRFSYGRRGILDLTHRRLFTRRSIRRLFEQCGFEIEVERGIPAPFPLALGDGPTARLLLAIHRSLIAVRPSLFAYQLFYVLRVRPDPVDRLSRSNAG